MMPFLTNPLAGIETPDEICPHCFCEPLDPLQSSSVGSNPSVIAEEGANDLHRFFFGHVGKIDYIELKYGEGRSLLLYS